MELTSTDKKILTLGLYSLSRSLKKMHPEAEKDIQATAEKVGVIHEYKTVKALDGKINKFIDEIQGSLNGLHEDKEEDKSIVDLIKKAMDSQDNPDLN